MDLKLYITVACIAMFVLRSNVANAQAFGVHEKSVERLSAARNIAPLAVDSVFGDQISHFNGSVTFNIVDVSVPGNSGLPVQLARSLQIDDRFRLTGLHLGGFGEWDVDIPHLSGIFSIQAGGWRPAGGTVDQRCSLPGAPPTSGSVPAEDYWNGYSLYVPGEGSQALLMDGSPMLPIPSAGTYPWITKKMWLVSCKPATKNGYAGQSFLAHSPDGLKYHFDWVVARTHAPLMNQGSGVSVARQVIYFLVSRVEDRFGNWVDYTYSGDKITQISSNDGRQISLTYSGNKISNVTSAVGSWTYIYIGERLSQVILPDSSKWTYSSTGDLALYPGGAPEILDPIGCPEPLMEYAGSYGLTVTAPSGVVGTFAFGPRVHKRSNVPETCTVVSIMPAFAYLKVPKEHWAMTLISKSISGPGLSAMTWNYTYGQPTFLGGHSRQNIVIGPENSWMRYTYGSGVNLNEGQLLRKEEGTGPSNIFRTSAYSYVDDAEAADQFFPAASGLNPLGYSDQLSTAWLRPLKHHAIQQQGVVFNWQVDMCGTKFCFDVFARPASATKSSTHVP